MPIAAVWTYTQETSQKPQLYCQETGGQRERETKREKGQQQLAPGAASPDPPSLNPVFRFGTVTPTMTEPISHQPTQTHTHTHSGQASPEQWGQNSSLISCDSD